MRKLVLTLVFILSVSHPLLAKSVDKSLYKGLSKALATKVEANVVGAASKILSVDEDDLKALNALAIFYYESGKHGLAKIILDRAIKAHPEFTDLKNNLALVYFASGDKKLGLLTLKDAAGDSSLSEAALNLSSIYVEHRDYQKALGPLSKSFSKVKGSLKSKSKPAIALTNNYGVALFGAEKIKESLEVFTYAHEAGVKDSTLLYNYAMLLTHKGKNKEDAYKVINRLKFLTDDQKMLRKVELLEKTLDNKK